MSEFYRVGSYRLPGELVVFRPLVSAGDNWCGSTISIGHKA
jgi:hypothetical protein